MTNATVDNVEICKMVISGIDLVHAMRFGTKEGVFQSADQGKRLAHIAERTGVTLHRIEALIMAARNMGFMTLDGESLSLTQTGKKLIKRDGLTDELDDHADLIKYMQRAVQQKFFDAVAANENLAKLEKRYGTSSTRSFIWAGSQVGVLKREGDKIYLTDSGKRYLTSDSPYSMCQLITILPLAYKMFANSFKGGHAEIFDSNKGMALMMTRAMHQKSAGLANRWPQQVDLSKAQTIMDVGAGSGIHVIEACRKFPNLQGTALDLPWITPITNEFIEKYGMRGRVKTASVDIFKKPLPNTDIIMMCDILHDWSDEKCNVILAKSWDALPSGGRIILLETLLNEDGIGPSVAVWFHLAVVKMLEGGQQRTGSKFRAMLKKAGFKDVTMTPSLSGATLIQAVKA